jgi:LacI family transcriptional regulator
MNSHSRIGIKEIAKLCGVSIGTVDRCLHNRKGVAAETREKVMACAREHGFRPNPVARRLVTGKADMVGAVLPTVQLTVENELSVLAAAKKTLSEHGYMLFIVPEGSAEEYADAYRDLAFAGCRAVISLSGRRSDPQNDTLKTIALLHRNDSPGAISLVPDEQKTGARACRYLCGKGHRQIAYFDIAFRGWAQKERLTGFMDQAAQFMADITCSVDVQTVVSAAAHKEVTAIFCHNDRLALQALSALESRGIAAPKDVSVMGVDDMRSLAYLRPDLTTMNYDFENLGRLAALQAIAITEEKQSPAPAIPPLEIVERKTVATITH